MCIFQTEKCQKALPSSLKAALQPPKVLKIDDFFRCIGQGQQFILVLFLFHFGTNLSRPIDLTFCQANFFFNLHGPAQVLLLGKPHLLTTSFLCLLFKISDEVERKSEDIYFCELPTNKKIPSFDEPWKGHFLFTTRPFCHAEKNDLPRCLRTDVLPKRLS